MDVRPIIETTYYSDPSGPVPASIQLTLTWNGTPQAPVTFSGSGHSPGDIYDLSVQVTAPVTTTGVYPWSMAILTTLPGGSTITNSISGRPRWWQTAQAIPMARDGAWEARRDWSPMAMEAISGSMATAAVATSRRETARLTSARRTTAEHSSKTTTAPIHTLILSKRRRASAPRVISPVSRCRTARRKTFSYNGSGALTAVTDPGGWTATFNYNGSGGLADIVEPGGRTVTFTYDSSDDMTSVVMPNASRVTFTYDSMGHMTSDSLGTQSTTYTFDSQGALSGTDTGLGNTMGVMPSSIPRFADLPGDRASQDAGHGDRRNGPRDDLHL